MADQRVIVIGGGLAGLAATMKIAELGTKVLLISFQPVKRSHSVCAQGGINGAPLIPPWAQTEWERFTGWNEIRSTLVPSSAIFIVAASPASPPPMTITL